MPSDSTVTLVRGVVVNFNGGTLVEQCVSSLLDQASATLAVQVVVVDNASVDGSADRLAQRFGDRVTLVRNARNEGYVAANAGFAPVAGLPTPDHVALVNPDATLEPGCLARLVDALTADPTLGAASPCMLFAHRFIDVVVRAPAEAAGRDPRALAVQLWGVAPGEAGEGDPAAPALADPPAHEDGSPPVGRLAQMWAGPGVGDVEEHGSGRFRWLGPDATVGVPVALGADAPTVTLHLSAPHPKRVDVHTAGQSTPLSVEVGPTPRAVTLTLDTSAATERIANAGSLVFDDGAGADRGHFAAWGPPFDEPAEVFAWCGGGVLLRGDYLNDVGMFEASLFLYYEDTDLAWRGRSRGWRYGYVPEARMRHVQGASGGAGSERFVVSTTRNRIVVAMRNAPRRVVRRTVAASVGELWASLRHEVLVPLAALRRPATRMARLRLRGLVGAAAATPRALVARRRLRRSATVPAEVVAAGLVPHQRGGHH